MESESRGRFGKVWSKQTRKKTTCRPPPKGRIPEKGCSSQKTDRHRHHPTRKSRPRCSIRRHRFSRPAPPLSQVGPLPQPRSESQASFLHLLLLPARRMLRQILFLQASRFLHPYPPVRRNL